MPGGGADTLIQAADELYGLPLADFTRARNEHARRLRQEGLRDEAETVKALRKPTAAAWTLNQLARQHPKEVKRIRATLHAAALDDQTAAELAAGRLVRDQEAVGLFGTGSVPAAGSGGPAAEESDRRGTRKAAEQRGREEQELASARAEEQKARRDHAGAVKATERAGKHAKDAQRRADEARKRAEEARAGLREAERRERDAARAYDHATRAVASKQMKLEP
jgi:hypothetical protein